MCIIVQNFIKISPIVLERAIFHYQDGQHVCLSTILHFNFNIFVINWIQMAN